MHNHFIYIECNCQGNYIIIEYYGIICSMCNNPRMARVRLKNIKNVKKMYGRCEYANKVGIMH